MTRQARWWFVNSKLPNAAWAKGTWRRRVNLRSSGSCFGFLLWFPVLAWLQLLLARWYVSLLRDARRHADLSSRWWVPFIHSIEGGNRARVGRRTPWSRLSWTLERKARRLVCNPGLLATGVALSRRSGKRRGNKRCDVLGNPYSPSLLKKSTREAGTVAAKRS